MSILDQYLTQVLDQYNTELERICETMLVSNSWGVLVVRTFSLRGISWTMTLSTEVPWGTIRELNEQE